MRFRVHLIGNRYHVQRRRFFRWQTVMHTHDAMLAERYCEVLSKGLPITERRLTQGEIDSDGSHRKKYFLVLTQVRSSVLPSTQEMK